MTRRLRRLGTVSACALIVALSIGYGELGSGTSDLVVGIGRTIVESTVYTGKTIGEFFKKAFGG